MKQEEKSNILWEFRYLDESSLQNSNWDLCEYTFSGHSFFNGYSDILKGSEEDNYQLHRPNNFFFVPLQNTEVNI